MIREFASGDIEAAIALWSNAEGIGLSSADSPGNLRQFLSRNRGLSFVFEENGKILGTILCGNDGRRGYLYHAFVDIRYRGKGIGRALVAKSLDALKSQGIEKCHLFVYETNEPAGRFWEKCGWTKRLDLAIFSRNL